MSQPRFSLVPVLDHEIHVTEWGEPGNEPLVMWHGLARTGRDFDELAAALSDRFHVLCPDTIGRGLSSWSHNPEAEYSVEYYSGIAADLLDHYGIDRAGWIGTSMGGLIGMRMASGPLAERLKWLIVNDIAPEIPQEAIDRILEYAGNEVRFATLAQAETWLRRVYAPFGPASDAFWLRMARHLGPAPARWRADHPFRPAHHRDVHRLPLRADQLGPVRPDHPARPCPVGRKLGHPAARLRRKDAGHRAETRRHRLSRLRPRPDPQPPAGPREDPRDHRNVEQGLRGPPVRPRSSWPGLPPAR